MSIALQKIIKEYRWGVVAVAEPVGVRAVRGFVIVLDCRAPTGAPLGYQVVFCGADGRPLDRFEIDDFRLFTCAAGQILEELGLPAPASQSEHIAALVILA